MRRTIWALPFCVAALVLPGCHGTQSHKSIASSEPPLAPVADADGTTIANTPPARSVTFVDRHPMFYKPRDYWDNAGDNKVVKATAATVVGIPAGIVGELKQIVVGAPGEPKY